MWRWVRNLFRIVSGLPNFLKVYRSQGWRKNPVSQSEKDRHRNTAGTSYWSPGTPPPPAVFSEIFWSADILDIVYDSLFLFQDLDQIDQDLKEGQVEKLLSQDVSMTHFNLVR